MILSQNNIVNLTFKLNCEDKREGFMKLLEKKEDLEI